ncbi:hypothetical protein HK405_007702 [Cladochytrium tenue]|nr:hypothetical protein HK405_007702 [Cladochytrium tenue]
MIVSTVLGSTRSGRVGLRVARNIEALLASKGHTVHFIDPKAYDLPLLDNRYKFLKAGGAGSYPAALDELHAQFTASDALVLVTPEYNYGIAPPLANLLNYFWFEEFRGKPAGVVTYSMGAFGGARAGVVSRPYVAGLGMVSIPTQLAVPAAHALLSEEGAVAASADATSAKFYKENAEAFVRELAWYSDALSAARAKGLGW